MRANRVIFFIILFFVSFAVYAADDYQDLLLLNQRAHDFLQEKLKAGPGERIVSSIEQLDNRLRLPKCDPAKIQIFFPNDEVAISAKTIGVSCHGEQAWTVYMASKVDIFEKIAVATQNIAKGTVLDNSNVGLVEQNREKLITGYFTSLDPLAKTVAKNTIIAGHVITPDVIQEETIVQQGDTVQINANSNNLVVEMTGVAMSSGGMGEHIYVLNPASKRTVEARIVGAGKVEAVL